jgi:hypothetical protein
MLTDEQEALASEEWLQEEWDTFFGGPLASGMLAYAGVCWRMLAYADVCWRMPPQHPQ